MKSFYRAFLCSCLVIVAMFAAPTQSKACDQSDFLLDSITFDGTNYTVFATLCIGGGTLVAASGANAFTADFAIAAYGGAGTIIGFTPPTLTSDTTLCPLTGGLAAAPPAPTGLSGTGDPATAYIVYQSLSFCPYTCISSTPICGLPHQDCNNLTITLSDFPDSLTAIGIEGQGNPANGCHRNFAPGYDTTITIDFTILPVLWGGFDATLDNESVELTWRTMQEANNDYFRVMRSSDARTWEEIATVNAVGNSSDPLNYDYIDRNPLNGVNYYRIQQIDIDSRFTETEVRSVVYEGPSEMDWRRVGPIPTHDRLMASFVVAESENLEVELYSVDGRVVHRENLAATYGFNSIDLDLSTFENGIYFLRIKGSQGVLEKKVVKI